MSIENVKDFIQHKSEIEPIGDDEDLSITVHSKFEACCTNKIPSTRDAFGFPSASFDKEDVEKLKEFLFGFTDKKLINQIRKAAYKDFVKEFSEDLSYAIHKYGVNDYAHKIAIDDLILYLLSEIGFANNLIDEIRKINYEVLHENKDFLNKMVELSKKSNIYPVK